MLTLEMLEKMLLAAAVELANIKDLLDDLSMAFMNSNGGSAGPLWGTVFGGLADASPEDAKEVSLEELHAMLAQAKEDFEDISKAKIGDKTMVAAMGKAAAEGAEKTADMVARFGRAKNVGERSLGTKDPGATSISILLTAMAGAI